MASSRASTSCTVSWSASTASTSRAASRWAFEQLGTPRRFRWWLDGLACTTAVHVCYGYGIKANIEWKSSLGEQWRQYEDVLPLLAASTVDQVSVECAGSRVPIELLGLLAGKDVLVGCIDVAAER